MKRALSLNMIFFLIADITLQHQICSGSDTDSDKASYQDLHHGQLSKHQ